MSEFLKRQNDMRLRLKIFNRRYEAVSPPSIYIGVSLRSQAICHVCISPCAVRVGMQTCYSTCSVAYSYVNVHCTDVHKLNND